MQQSQTFTTPNSLVKYASAVLVSNNEKKSQLEKQKGRTQKTQQTQTEDILNSILPPRQFNVDKQQLWIQSVSATPATRGDVLELQANIDKKLQQRQARETGICPIREELYAQCFDELIRQITINCAERGILLVRVRDELRSTIQAYQTSYESSIAYGMRKALQAEQRKQEMEGKKKQLEIECNELQKQVEQLEKKIDDIVQNDEEQRESDEQQHQQEIQDWKAKNLIFKNKLDALLNGPQQQAQAKK